MYLDDDEFARVIAATPLVAIDLIVRDAQDRILLGKRLNRPALGYWFVPGGRIRKNEPWRIALRRIATAELGHGIVDPEGHFIGLFDHFYDDNVFGRPGVGTHYVVAAYAVRLQNGGAPVADAQHAALRWWPIPELLSSDAVHDYTKQYFRLPAALGIATTATS